MNGYHYLPTLNGLGVALWIVAWGVWRWAKRN